MFPTSTMYPATISLTSLCIDVAQQDDKFVAPPAHVYVRQPYNGLQIIQLEEEPAPPPRLLPSSSSLASSESESASGTRSYWSSSYYSESACSEDEEEEELEEGEELEEYCSSDEGDDEEAMEVDGGSDELMDSSRMKRILAWRADFYAQVGASLSESSLLKRKLDNDDEVSSQSSKRSRRSSSSAASTSPSSLGMHACPACDTTFDTQHGLRQHGLDAAASKMSEACCTAVEYEFE